MSFDRVDSVSIMRRLLVVAACCIAGALYLARASSAEEVPPRESLVSMPMLIDGWKGTRDPDFTPEVLKVLGVDDYTVRTYSRGATLPVGLYVGYHSSQRQGDTIHSPLNCLPGSGWQPMSVGRAQVLVRDAAGSERPIEVNRVLIAKGLDRNLVFYWYQSHRRVVASEYWGKVYTVLDSIRYHRTDAALIRLVVPIPEANMEGLADTTGREFMQALFPLLGRHLPT